MPYTKTTWTDRQVQRPLTFTQTTNADGSITLAPAEGTVTQAGTPITAAELNNLETQYDSAVAVALTAKTGTPSDKYQKGNTGTLSFAANTTTDTTIQFPTAFPSTPFVMFTVTGDTALNYFMTYTLYSVAADKFVIRAKNGAGISGWASFNWFAIGQ